MAILKVRIKSVLFAVIVNYFTLLFYKKQKLNNCLIYVVTLSRCYVLVILIWKYYCNMYIINKGLGVFLDIYLFIKFILFTFGKRVQILK